LLHYARCAGGFMPLLDVKNGAQQDRVEAYQFCRCMAKDLGDKVLLNQAVQTIFQDENSVKVATDGNKIFTAKFVVLAIPPILCEKITYNPPLPIPRQHLTQRASMGQVIKFFIFYEECFWVKDGFCGEVVSGRTSVNLTFDATIKDIPAIVGFFEAAAARYWADKTQEERKEEVASLLYNSFNNKKALNPVHYIEQDWQKEQWSLGGYTGVLPPGILTGCGLALSQPVGRIHWAGTETASHWTGYIEGGLQSGERAAQEVISKLSGKQNPVSITQYIFPFPVPKSQKNIWLKISVISVLLAVAWYWFGKYLSF